MRKVLALLLAALSLLSLAACGAAPLPPEPTGAPEQRVQETPAAEAGPPAPVLTVSDADVSLAGLETLDDVYAHLDSTLPRDEELIPYVGDIYHAGDNTLIFLLFGFCTRGGEIVTKPVFSGVEAVRSAAGAPSGQEALYLCFLPAPVSGPHLRTLNGAAADGRSYEEPVPQDGLVRGGLGDVVDDGFYYLDGYTLIQNADGSSYADFSGHEDGRYEIRRKSDGAKVAVTELPPYCWPGLFFCDAAGGRVYFTMADGICTTWNSDFEPIVSVPAAGARSLELFTAPQKSEPEIAPEATPLALSAGEQYEANLFLSNFSEQGFCQSLLFDRFDADGEVSIPQLFSFAHLWAKINRRSAISYEDGFEVMTREAFREIVSRYFDLDTIPEPQEGADYSKALGMGNHDRDRCWYENGRFHYPAADGESYTGFSVVDEAGELFPGRVRFRFTIYALDLDIYWANNGIPDEYYHLTPAEAAQRAAKGEISPVRTGTAVCSRLYLEANKRESWSLVSYTLDAGN